MVSIGFPAIDLAKDVFDFFFFQFFSFAYYNQVRKYVNIQRISLLTTVFFHFRLNQSPKLKSEARFGISGSDYP